jgi:hypothetical protein
MDRFYLKAKGREETNPSAHVQAWNEGGVGGVRGRGAV